MHEFNHCVLASAGGQVDYGYKVVVVSVVWSYLCDGGAIDMYGSSGGCYVMKVVGCKEEPSSWCNCQ